MHIYIHICLLVYIYTCVSLSLYISSCPAGQPPPPRQEWVPKRQKLAKTTSKQKLMLGGVPEALGGGLGTILTPKGVLGTPGD